MRRKCIQGNRFDEIQPRMQLELCCERPQHKRAGRAEAP